MDLGLSPKKENAITFPQERKQKILIAVLGMVVLGTALFIYFGDFWRSPAAQPVSTPDVLPATLPGASVSGQSSSSLLPTGRGGATLEEIIKKMEFNLGFLEGPSFKTLKTYGQWPLEIGAKGRPNPFVSF